MNNIPSTLTKRQAIKYAVTAFYDFINSGNKDYFDISVIETFYTGAMEAHNKKTIVEFTDDLIENHKGKMKIIVEKKDM